jgi:hypothetical protein
MRDSWAARIWELEILEKDQDLYQEVADYCDSVIVCATAPLLLFYFQLI